MKSITIKIFILIFSLAFFSEVISSFNTVDAYYLRRCAYGRCKTNAGCDDGGQCIDMNGDGLKECDNGICNTTADCKGAANGGVAVCRDENNDGLKECANLYCPIGMTIPGANCDCSAGRTCGQTCNASVGLCQDGVSTCTYIVGPNCRVSRPNGVDETTYCVPRNAPGITNFKCVARDQYNGYALYNGNNPTVQDLANLCTQIACQPANPASATLLSPTDNSQVALGLNDSVALSYTIGDWGVACPANNNSYDVQLSPNCTGFYSSYSNATQFLGLTKGGVYCWRVIKDNGNGVKVPSRVNRFNVLDDRALVVTAGLKADVCGGGFSGVAGSPLVSNPIDYSFNFSSSATNKYREAWIAMVPDNDNYNRRCQALGGGTIIDNTVCQNMESADVQTEAVMLQKVKSAKSVVFKIILDTAGNPIEARAYNGVSWNSITSPGNVSGLGGTLMDFKNGSTSGVQSTNLASNFRIRLDSSPLGKYAFYIATVISDANGNIKTSYATTANSYMFKRVSATTTLSNWGIDLNPPASTGAFTSAKYLANNQFQINWSFNEANALRIKSYISRDNADSNLIQVPSPIIDFGSQYQLPNLQNFNNGNLAYLNVNTGNGLVDENSQGIRTYQDGDPSKQSNYQFYAFAADIACNQKVVSTSAAIQKPWVLSYNGDTSAKRGITGLSLPTSLNQLTEPLKASNSIILSDLNSVSLSTYGVISGNSDIPLRKTSRMRQFVTNYDDLTIKPPLDAGFTKWYDYVYNLVSKNAPSIITTISTSATLGGNTSGFVGTQSGTKKHIVIEGNLTVNSGTVCDTQTIFFVKGTTTAPLDPIYPNSTLKIIPDLKVSGNNNGCLFVTNGDILIDNGSKASPSIGIDAPTLSNYDLIEAALISDGKLITLKDVPSATEKGDGLAIKGSVVTEDLTLQRDININANQFQPAHLFYFDPRYREIFKSDMDYNKYSLREVGYATPN